MTAVRNVPVGEERIRERGRRRKKYGREVRERKKKKWKERREGGRKTSLHYSDVIVSYFTVRLVTTELWASAKLFSKAISSSPYEKKSIISSLP